MFEYKEEVKKIGIKVAKSETIAGILKNIQEFEKTLTNMKQVPKPNRNDPFYLKLLMSQLDILMLTSEILAVKDDVKKTKEFMERFSKGLDKEKELRTVIAVTREISRVCKEVFLNKIIEEV